MLKEKSKIITVFVFDFETGGTDPQTCACIQLSMHALRLDTFEELGKINLYIAPYNYQEDIVRKAKKKVLVSKWEEEGTTSMIYSKEAEEVHGISMDVIKAKGIPIEDACDQIMTFIKENTFEVAGDNKPFLCGQNPLFDIGFLQQMFAYSGKLSALSKLLRGVKDFWGNWQPYYLDTIILFRLAFGDDETVDSCKLELEAEKLGIDLDDAHDADADVLATREIMRILSIKMRNGGEEVKAISLDTHKEKTRIHFKI